MLRPFMATHPFLLEVADGLARLALRVPALERALLMGARRPVLRRHLRLGAIALGYPRVLGRRELRIAELDGYRFYVNVGESLGVEPYFFGSTCTVDFTRALIGPGDVCVDAGANAGHYTFFCASVVGPRGRVIAFEPNPEFAELLARSVRLNGYGDIVQIEERALDSVSGEVKRFYVSVSPTNTGTSSLVNHGCFLSDERTIEVQTVTFDDFARDAAIGRFRLVKIDVERAEDFVISGARRTLAEGRIDFLILEMEAGGVAQKLLLEAGYRGFLISNGTASIPVGQVQKDWFGDFLFVRPGLEAPSR
jgi:FkbM family methyltransferase